ncbi:MAG: hypothetical protein JSW55_11560 [Chloroflexota bacterium]|nr:MAG: hypothetical protein JSW55_11560 [Chloroflexota bacterium]
MGKRILGVVLILVGLLGLLISIGGLVISRSVIGELGAGLDTTFTLASDSLDTVEDTLLLTKTTIDQASGSLDTLTATAINVSATMNDTQPLMDRVTQSATQELPESIEAIQGAIPDVAEAAGAIDDTLRILDSFEVDRQIFGIPIQFDLGINYQPMAPLNETVLALGGSLDGVPEDLRALEGDMLRASANMAAIGGNIETIAEDLKAISTTVDDIEPLLDQYLDIVAQTQELIAQAQTDLDGQLAQLQLAITALFVWLGLNQIVPFYLGWTLISGGEDKDYEELDGTGANPSVPTVTNAEYRSPGDRDEKVSGELEADES